jgi:hypothetical protein
MEIVHVRQLFDGPVMALAVSLQKVIERCGYQRQQRRRPIGRVVFWHIPHELERLCQIYLVPSNHNCYRTDLAFCMCMNEKGAVKGK